MIKLDTVDRANIAQSIIGNHRCEAPRPNDYGGPVFDQSTTFMLVDRFLSGVETEDDQRIASMILNHTPYVRPDVARKVETHVGDFRRIAKRWDRTAEKLFAAYPVTAQTIPHAYDWCREVMKGNRID